MQHQKQTLFTAKGAHDRMMVSACPAVHQDRIGASNFFWSFPSGAAVKVPTHRPWTFCACCGCEKDSPSAYVEHGHVPLVIMEMAFDTARPCFACS